MTTIVYDGKTLSCDSRVSSNVSIRDDADKVLSLSERNVYHNGKQVISIAFAGDADAKASFHIRTRYGMKELVEVLNSLEKDIHKSTCLAVLEDGIVVSFKREDGVFVKLFPKGNKIVIGTGANNVTRFMLHTLNLSSATVVKVAMWFDKSTGGMVHTY